MRNPSPSEIPHVRTLVSAEEWAVREDLAACYRLVAHYGWDDMIFTHISARVPGEDDHFLINPYGHMFEEITASSLVKVDHDGHALIGGGALTNPAGFTIHSAVHAAIGIWGLVAWQADHIGRRVRSPRMFARAIAIFYGALALLGLFPGLNTFYGLLPIHGHDVWLHGATGLVAAYFGWRAKTEVERRNAPVADRREQVEPVVHDRRRGHGDRRIPTSEV